MAYQKVNFEPGDVLKAEQVNLLQDTVMKNEGNLDALTKPGNANDGKFLRVSNGVAMWVSLDTAEEGSF